MLGLLLELAERFWCSCVREPYGSFLYCGDLQDLASPLVAQQSTYNLRKKAKFHIRLRPNAQVRRQGGIIDKYQ